MKKDIDENYSIYSDGNVFSKRKNKFLKIFHNTKKYPCVELYCKNFRVHRLVAQYFIPNPNNYTQVNHIDGNKNNNDVSNLEWCSNRMNVIHYYKSKSPGVSLTKSNKYSLRMYLNGKQLHIGTYNTIEEANNAYSNVLAQHT